MFFLRHSVECNFGPNDWSVAQMIVRSGFAAFFSELVNPFWPVTGLLTGKPGRKNSFLIMVQSILIAKMFFFPFL